MAYENNIEWITNQEIVTATISQGRYITKIKKLAEQHPNDVRIMEENKDGSILCQFPLRYLKINNPSRVMTEEQKAAAAERLKRARKNK